MSALMLLALAGMGVVAGLLALSHRRCWAGGMSGSSAKIVPEAGLSMRGAKFFSSPAGAVRGAARGALSSRTTIVTVSTKRENSIIANAANGRVPAL